MNVLVVKDLMNLRQSLKTMVILILVFAVIFIPTGNTTTLSFLLVIFASMFPLTSMVYDDMVKWDRYALTMPLSRKDMVAGKYQLMLLMLGIGIGLSLLITAIGVTAAPALFLTAVNPFQFILAVGSLGLVYGSVLLPVLYRFGTENTRFIMIGSMIVIGALLLGTFVLFGGILADISILFWILPPAIALVCLAASYRIALRVYMNKEF